MSREVRDYRDKLRKKWYGLRESANCSQSIEIGVKLREQEDKVYKLWKFYDGLIKAFDLIIVQEV